jgi:hypothetical protein
MKLFDNKSNGMDETCHCESLRDEAIFYHMWE